MGAWDALSRRLVELLFGPVIVVGDKRKALNRDEVDHDIAELGRLNRVWRDMLAKDPWMVRLTLHIRLLGGVSFALFLLLIGAVITAPAADALTTCILLAFAITAPYWFWIARWRTRIEQKVFLEFTKRYGKHYHLK